MTERKCHILRGVKKSQTINRCMFFDTETDQIQVDPLTVKHELNFGFCLSTRRNNRGGWTAPYYYRFDSISGFYDILESLTAVKSTLYCFCHNTNFDLAVLDLFVQLPERGWTMKMACIEAPPTIIKFTKDHRNIIFLDTLNYWPTSLVKIGEALNLPKLDFPASFDDQATADAYCKRDCEIIYKAVTVWSDFIVNEDLGKYAYTAAGQAMSSYLHRFCHHPIYIHTNDAALVIERKAYSGGRSEPFRIGKFDGPWHQYDVNSMYPFVMAGNNYPTKLRYHCMSASVNRLRRALDEYKLIADVTLWADEPVYPVKFNHKLIFPVGRIRACLSTPELQYAFEHGHIIKCHSFNAYDSAPLFTKYVDYFYGRRLQAKQDNNLILSNQYKLLLNSLYGKFGQRGEVYEECGRAGDLSAEVWEEIDADSGEVIKYRKFGGLIQEKTREIESYNSFPAIAAHVTSYARMYLLSLIKRCNKGNTAYTDTDCLVVNNKGKVALDKLIDQTKLGKLKYEGTYKSITIYGPKDYEFGDNVKHKGVKRSAVWITGNRAAQEQWASLKGMLRAGKISEPTTRGIYKTLHRNYDKSSIMQSGKCRPYRFGVGAGGVNYCRY